MSADPPLSRQPTVLLVEDEEPVRGLVQLVLEKNGYRVCPARDGVEALSLYAPQIDSIDLLVTDVLMPQMSGYELANRLLAKKPSLKIIFMSGFTANAGSDASSHPVHASHLQKPFMPRDLTQLIARQLGTEP